MDSGVSIIHPVEPGHTGEPLATSGGPSVAGRDRGRSRVPSGNGTGVTTALEVPRVAGSGPSSDPGAGDGR